MTRTEKTTREKQELRAAERATEKKLRAKKVLNQLQQVAAELDRAGHPANKIAAEIRAQIEWAIAEDEAYTTAAAELWADQGGGYGAVMTEEADMRDQPY